MALLTAGACGGGGDGPVGPQVGRIVVTVTTAGVDLDQDGYVVATGTVTAPVASGGTAVTLESVPVGDRTVTLSGLAANCTAPSLEQRVRVSAGAAASIAFTVTCAAPPQASATLAVSTTGFELDADGYQLTVDGGAPQPVAANGAPVVIPQLSEGVHLLALSGLAENCSVTGEHPRTVTASPGSALSVTLAVVCRTSVARIEVRRRFPTTFENDTTVLVATAYRADGTPIAGKQVQWSSSVSSIATVQATGTGGASGVATGASPGASTLTATVDGVSGSETLVVLGRAVRPNREIAYLRDAARPADGVFTSQLRTVRADATNGVAVTPLDQEVWEYDWAPDGSRFVVSYITSGGLGKSGLYLLNPDGSGETLIGGNVGMPQWSPDGSRIVYESSRFPSDATDIYTMNATGGDVRRITTAGGGDIVPRWSPDGRQIAYARAYTTSAPELWIASADGSVAPRRIDVPVARNPRWSPDGKTIAFDDLYDLWLVSVDGERVTRVTNHCPTTAPCSTSLRVQIPAWSPDARQVAISVWDFNSSTGSVQLPTVGRTTPPVTLSSSAGGILQWSPDGTRLLFGMRVQVGASNWPGFATMQTDGSDQRAVTGAENAAAPQWRP